MATTVSEWVVSSASVLDTVVIAVLLLGLPVDAVEDARIVFTPCPSSRSVVVGDDGGPGGSCDCGGWG